MFWLLAVASLLLAWFCWQLFGPNRPIRIAPETTHVVEPLRPNGQPNYTKYLLTKRRAGVTPENNAAVVMWQTYGLSQDFDDLSAEDWQILDRELSLGPPPDAEQALAGIHNRENRAAVLEWLAANVPEWKRPPSVDAAALAEIGMTQSEYEADSIIDVARSSPWKRSDLPPLADWLDRNRTALDALTEASKRPHLFSPSPSLLRNEDTPLVAAWSSIEISRAREIARVLKLRAMLHIGEGRHTEAWQDLLAVHRWARLVGQGPFAVDQLVAVAIDGIASDGDISLLASDGISPTAARNIQLDLQQLTPPSDIARAFDDGERVFYLDAISNYRQKGIGAFYTDNFNFDLDAGRPRSSTWTAELLNFVSADWNNALTEGNRWHDRVVTAGRLKSYAERQQQFDQLSAELQILEAELQSPRGWIIAAISSAKRSEMLATAAIATFSPAWVAMTDADDRATTTLALTQLAAALTVYRAEHGQYPDRLEQLVPNVIGELPVDLYHAKQFVYQRDAEGYLLYSTGPNGIDDGGSNELRQILAGREPPEHEEAAAEQHRQKIPTGADDLSICVPVPHFQLRAPPSSPQP
jgi:hypothetical protein